MGGMTDQATPIAIGLTLPTWPRADRTYATWPELRALAREAEAMGVDTLWVPDHLQRDMASGERIGFWECWTIVTALAEATTTVGIGPYVACTGFRNPALLAKMAATLDEVSDGRLVLGLGSGVPERDTSWRAYGFDATRPVARYAEAVEVVTRMLREPAVTFDGEFFRTDDAQIIPRRAENRAAVGPPVWVAGLGDRTSRVAAAFGDAINVNVPLCGTSDMDRVVDIAARACDAVGRDPATLELTGWARLVLEEDGTALPRAGCLSGSTAEVAATVRGFVEAGLRHLTFYVGAPDDPSRLPALTPATLARFAPVLEAVRAG
jgi:alkanesulfonate monooxygenase SsuD/methylene tetrahydromethanopterin reductase-like flavin-dependent oxidoreductase (luciferase family)